ncbi:MAG: MazG family protein [Oscillospiraceae bacterium]|nr:MazG family protein [Oscillospiraceae bacterium]MBR4192925.1 MazG family protein [Oscillospiraceae bacterium]
MIDFTEKSEYGFSDLVRLVAALRGPGGCPWDQVQTHQSIRRNFLEEAYEACEAMDADDPIHLREELGDVLLQVVFHAGIEADAGRFDVDGVCDAVCRKLIDRHPHLFDRAPSRMDWEELKRAERGNQTVAQAMEGVSRALPALWRADKLLSKAEKSGYPQPETAALCRELTRQTAALCQTEGSEAQTHLGRALFALVRLARGAELDPESALTETCQQFIDSFSHWEAAALQAEK